jgi:hypothetical protein
MFARHNPNGKGFGREVSVVWRDHPKVEELKKNIIDALDAGNFDLARKFVDELVNYHN